MKFRKKPVVIEAWKAADLLGAAAGEWDALPEQIKAGYDAGNVIFLPYKIHIKTLEGWVDGSVGDWIIEGVAGELYPCKPEIFDATYEVVQA